MIPRFAVALFLASAALAAPPEQKTSAKGLTYQVRMPEKFVKGQHPLVFALHGAGDTCANFMRWLTDPASTLPKDAILLAPQALKNGSWEKEDVEPLIDLLKSAKAEYAPVRTVLFGFSRGAYFTFLLGTSYPDLFDGAIPHSGGLPGAVTESEALKKLPFYVCHGDKDGNVPVSESERSVAALEKAGVKVKFEKIPGLDHTVDWKAVKNGLDWIDGILAERQKASDEVVGAKVADLEKALKAKDGVAAAFDAIERVSPKFAAKVAGLAKSNVTNADEAIALAAIACAGRCGADGVAALKAIPGTNEKLAVPAAAALGATRAPAAAEPLGAYLKTKSDGVATAAAEALAALGGDPAVNALIAGLSNTETLLPASPRKGAILDALKKITGESFAKSSEWKKWQAGKK